MKTNWLRTFRSHGEPLTALALGLVLSTYANEDGAGIHVSSVSLASQLGVSVRTVDKHLRNLIAAGWIRPMDTSSIGTTYWLAMPKRGGSVSAL